MILDKDKVYRALLPQWGKPYLLKVESYAPKRNWADVAVYSFYYTELSKPFDERFTLEYFERDVEEWLENGWLKPEIEHETVELDEDLFNI